MNRNQMGIKKDVFLFFVAPQNIRYMSNRKIIELDSGDDLGKFDP